MPWLTVNSGPWDVSKSCVTQLAASWMQVRKMNARCYREKHYEDLH